MPENRTDSPLQWRFATSADARVLAELNHQLIADEGHRNPMAVPELERRMWHWLGSEYRAVLFSRGAELVAYALYRDHEGGGLYLRQFFVVRHLRRTRVGEQAMQTFREQIAPEATRIVVEVLAHNRPGRAFWTKSGFREYALTLEYLAEGPDPER